MKYREKKVIRFIKPPFKGDKIKVYVAPGSDKGFYYGYADKIILDTSIENGDIITKEMLVIDLSKTEFELNDVDYFFIESRVFVNKVEEEEELQN